MDRLDIFLPPLPPHLHLHGHVFSRRLMRPNAGVHASPRVPVKRPRHLISYGWRHLRQSSHGPPHPHLLSRPVDKDLWCHSSSASLPPSFLPYSSLILPLLYSREFCRLFFFSFSDFERENGSKFALFLQRGEERNFWYRLERIETNDCYSVVLIQEGYTILSFRLGSFRILILEEI